MVARLYRRFVRAGLLLGAMLALAGCGGATQPTDLQTPHVNGEFDLVEYDGNPLPTALGVVVGVSGIAGDRRSFSCPEMLTAARLELSSDSAVTRTSHISYPCTGSLPHPSIPDSVTKAEYGSVRTTGDSLTFTFNGRSGATTTEYARVAANDLIFYLERSGSLLTGTVGMVHRVYRKELGTGGLGSRVD